MSEAAFIDFRQILKGLGITQTALAEMVGIDGPHMNRIINRKICPKNSLALAIEAALGGAISAAELKGLPRPTQYTNPPKAA